jgi:hypothetical protein
MARRPVVVDGSNLATEGRSTPSLAQLDEAVRAWLAENPDDEVIVVVDASFSYRIDESERRTFEEAEAAGELVSPPAGALGRGDGFLLRIADRVDAAVLSNDSFQEFHGDYPWLFDTGRLLGGKPVPGVGWIFTPRTPVRGPKSRMAVRDAKRSETKEMSGPVVEAIAEATAEAMAPEPTPSRSGRRRRRGSRDGAAAPSHEAVNEPLPFITFIAEHHLGTEVEGTVDSFTSHGAFVVADGARCYVPVVGLGDPPPRTAKAVLKRGETRAFVVQALDPPRRGIELALPGLARVSGAPTEETVEAEIGARGRREKAGDAPAPAPGRSRTRRTAPKAEVPEGPPVVAPAESAPAPAPAKPRGGRKAARVPQAAPAQAPPGRPRRAPGRTRAPHEPAPPAVAADASDAPAAVPAPRPRKRAAKAAAPAGSPVEAAPVPAREPAPVPASGTRKRAAKAAAPAPADAPATATANAAPPAEPAPRTRKRAKKAAPAAPPAAPAARTRKRSAKAASAGTPPPDSEPAPKRGRKRT